MKCTEDPIPLADAPTNPQTDPREYPPVGIAAANTWTKDLNDTMNGYRGNVSSTSPIASYKTTVSNSYRACLLLR